MFKTPPLMGHNESLLPPIKSRNHALQLVSGPFIMALFLVLQSIKKEMTGTHASLLYDNIWKFICKAEARDKVGRMVQYFCRSLQGILVHMPDSPLAPYKSAIAEIQTTLAWARRTHRWGKEMPHIPKLAKALTAGNLLDITQSAVLITFLVQDHIYWLLKVGILKFKAYTPVQWHRRNLRFITFNHVLNFSLCVRDIRKIRAKQEKGDPEFSGSDKAIQKADKAIGDNKRQMFRYVLTFIQMCHVAQLRIMDDWYIGLMGVVSAYIDASKQWPSS